MATKNEIQIVTIRPQMNGVPEDGLQSPPRGLYFAHEHKGGSFGSAGKKTIKHGNWHGKKGHFI